MDKTALVTGGNRGIGFAVCRGLTQMGLKVILTSRDGEKGNNAAEILRQEGYELDDHPLDVIDAESISILKNYIVETYGRLDVLINNAGVSLDKGRAILDVPLDVVRETLEVNFYGPLNMCRAFIPLMKEHQYGRVVNVSSELGSLSRMSGRTGAYKVSKAALNALTRIIAGEVKGQNIKVNTMSPGWVRTDMGGPSAPRSLEEGADTILWLATLPDDGPTGGFFRDREAISW
jgi:NAD(P)-dependent dehydrogenase (short-subunit alcohol dehydrogenase family)